MSDLILGPVVGKIGGAEVETIDIPRTTSSGNRVTVTLHPLEVPEGETWLVSLVGEVTVGSSSSTPVIQMGSTSAAASGAGSSEFGISTVLTAPTTLTMRRTTGGASDSIEGTLRIVRL